MIDALISLLQSDPAYRTFNFDAQTVVLEDYLDLRPEQCEVLDGLIRSKRIIVGPWYILPDEFVSGDELLVRNLLAGTRLAKSFGADSRVGYLPDMFGHIGQMPQILNGFGINTAIVWRGISSSTLPSEFTWEGSDGSTVLTHRINEKVGYGIGWFQRWTIHSVLGEDIAPADIAGIQNKAHWFVRLVEHIARDAATDVIYFSNGTDHVCADPELPAWIERARELRPDWQISHSSFDEYFSALREAVTSVPLQTVTGELRQVNMVPFDHAGLTPVNCIVYGIDSTHIPLKLKHHACEQLLQYCSDPLAAWAGLPNDPAPDPVISLALQRAWREFLRTQPHDSIGGCSIDAVIQDMHQRFRHTIEYATDALFNALRRLFMQQGFTPALARPTHAVFTHLSPYPLSSGCEIELGIPEDDARNGVFGFTTLDNTPVQAVVEFLPGHPGFQTYPEWYEGMARTARISLMPGPCSGYELKSLRIDRSVQLPLRSWQTVPEAVLENESLSVTISQDGRISVTDLRTGSVYDNVLSFEDGGDAGDTYTFSPPAADTLICTFSQIPVIEYGGETPVVRRVRMHTALSVPDSLAPDRRTRDTGQVELPLCIELSLWDASDVLDIQITVDNTAKDHRLRCLVHTGASSQTAWAEGHFDLIQHPARSTPPPPEAWIEDAPVEFPNKRFIAAFDGTRGLAVVTHGLQEHQYLPENRGALAVTLLRCVGWVSQRNLVTRRENVAPSIPVPDAQLPGKHTLSLSIFPCTAESMLPAAQEKAALCNRRNYLFTGTFEQTEQSGMSFCQVHGAAVSALKPAEDGDGIIIRLWNGMPESRQAHVSFPCLSIAEVIDTMLDESPCMSQDPPALSGNNFSLSIGPKKIRTFRIILEQ